MNRSSAHFMSMLGDCVRAGLLVVIIFTAHSRLHAADMSKTLRVAIDSETGFDPAQASDANSGLIMSVLYQGLLTFDYLASPEQMIGAAAEALPEISADGLIYTFRMRKGNRFHPHPAFGDRTRELTAHDVVYSWKRHIDPKLRSAFPYLFEGRIVGMKEAADAARQSNRLDYNKPIDGLQAIDEHTLRVTLTKPDRSFLFDTSTWIYAIVAREVVEAYSSSELTANPIGTGAYILESRVRGSKIVLKANPTYAKYATGEPSVFNFRGGAGDVAAQRAARENNGKPLPIVGRIEISVIEESQAVWLAFLNNQLDVITLPRDLAPKALKEGKLLPEFAARGIRAQRDIELGTIYMMFNIRDVVIGGLQKEKIALRRAMSLAYNLEELVRIIYQGEAVVAQHLIPPGQNGRDPHYKNALAAYDPELARALLDRFGYRDRDGDGYREMPDGRPLTIEFTTTPANISRQIDELWTRSMDAIGIRTVIRKERIADIIKLNSACRLQVNSLGWFWSAPEGDIYMTLAEGKNIGKINGACFDLPEYNERAERAASTRNNATRVQLTNEMMDLLFTYGAIRPGIHRYTTTLAQPHVRGFRVHRFMGPIWPYLDIEK
jgi:oligopeptide transport system substrate-binding protein